MKELGERIRVLPEKVKNRFPQWPIFRYNASEQLKDLHRFSSRLSSEECQRVLLSEAEERIAEYYYRRPIVLSWGLAIRPFWRDGKKVPPLPVVSNIHIPAEPLPNPYDPDRKHRST